MGMMQRRKGRAGEQEIAAILRYELGLEIRRNWEQQAAEGGADLTGIPGWAAEIKFCAHWSALWWPQAVEQADRCNRRPVLFYRITGTRRGQPTTEKWRAVVRLRDLAGEDVDNHHCAEISLGGWIQFTRETLTAPDVHPDSHQETPQCTETAH